MAKFGSLAKKKVFEGLKGVKVYEESREGAYVNKGVGFAIWFVAESREPARRRSQQRDPRKKKKKKR